jgi:hypothetical protein
MSKPAVPFKILFVTNFIVLDYLKLDTANGLARCYVFFALGVNQEHFTDILSAIPFISYSKLFFIGNAE